MEKYEREQALRQKLKEEERKKKIMLAQEAAMLKGESGDGNLSDEDDGELSDTALGDSDEDGLDEDDDDDVKLKDGKAVLFGSTQGKTFHKMTQRNLRIREHTAKYLLNLDPNSAHYDPKSRSMRSNPRQDQGDEATFSGDNFVRHTGEVSEMAKTQLFAWEAYNKGEDAAHLQANPTQVELAKKQFHERKEKILAAKKKKRLDKYGGEEHLESRSHAERFGEESRYVEYDVHGNVVKGFEQAVPRSKWGVEDQHPQGHTSVWGSWYDCDELKWGYSCCWQTNKNAICVGENGKAAILEGKKWLKEAAARVHNDGGGTGENHANAADKKREERPSSYNSAGVRSDGWSRDGDFDAMNRHQKIDSEKLKQAMKEEREKKKRKRESGGAEIVDGAAAAAAAATAATAATTAAAAAAQSHFGAGAEETMEMVEAKRLMKDRKNDPMLNLDDNEILPMDGGKDGGGNDQLRQTA